MSVGVCAKGVLSPKESAEFIVHQAKHVSIVQDGINRCAHEIFQAIVSGSLSPRNFSQSGLHPMPSDPKAVDWIFVVDTLNFSFWSGTSADDGESTDPKWVVRYKGESYTGYFALCAGVNRAIEEEGLDMTDPKIYGSLTADDIKRIFRSETSTPIPLVEDRIANLQEASRVLLEKYQGSFVNCVKASGPSALRLLNQVVSDFASYRDQAVFDGVSVSFYKRAQILIGDIWACFAGEGLGSFDDIEALTMFADYRIPQVLLYYGALKYSEELLQYLAKEQLLENGDPREVEIRGASIQAVELVKSKVREKLEAASLLPKLVNSVLIDHFLWDYRRKYVEELDKYPYHRTRCIYY